MPVITIDPSWFPKSTLQEGSPVGGVLSDAIAKRLAMANAKKAEAEVPYAGLSSFANALSHMAYAGAVTPQYAAKLAGNKQIWSNMTPEQQAAAVQLASAPGTGGSTAGIGGGSMAPFIQHAMDIYNRQNQPQSQGGILSLIKNFLSGNQQNAGQSLSPQIQQPVVQQNPVLPVVSPELGQQPRAFQNEANYTAGQNQAASTGTATGNQSAKQLELAQTNSQNALNMDNLIDSAVTTAKNVIFKGPILGNLAAYGPDSAQLLKDTNTMAVTLANQLYGANTTNAKDATATTLKLNVKDPEKAFNMVAEKLKAQNDRIKGQGTFYETMNTLGITDPRVRDQIWFDYNSKYPPYDYKTHKPIRENLGVDTEKFSDFIRKDYSDNKTLKKKIETTLKQQTSEEEKKFVGNDTQKRWKPEDITVESLQHIK